MDITVGIVSRLKSVSHNKKVINDFNDHKIDILIGTHRLLSKDVANDLIIIDDEEQRFALNIKKRLSRYLVILIF